MASLINKPLTSSLYSSKKTENPLLNRFRLGHNNSVTFKNAQNFVGNNSKNLCFSISCKAVSVEKESKTDIEGLNIADDVTQVKFYHFW